MRHVLSSYLFVEQRVTVALLHRILQSGIDEIELFCARQHLDYRNKSQIEELGHWLRDSEMTVHSLHSPLFSDDAWGLSGPHAVVSITETSKVRRIKATDEIKRAIEIADNIPFRYLVQHIGMADEEYDLAKLDAAFNCLDELNIFGKQLGVEILVENTANEFSSARQLLHLIESTHLPLSFCFDIGHAHLQEGVDHEFRLMKDRIRSTNVHDNDGERDMHLFPLHSDIGSVPWASTMQLLRSLPEDVPMVMELRDDASMADPLVEARHTLNRLEGL